jgi:predicted nucleic acid-binding protein
LNRPFDDQTQERVNIEARAVVLILQRISTGVHQLCSSTALVVENNQNPNNDRRTKIDETLKGAQIQIMFEQGLDSRIDELRAFGFREFDAYHVALAEAGQCDRLVTCDDQLLRIARRNKDKIKVTVADPISLISEANFS